MDLNQLAAIAEAAIPYTPTNYPALAGKTDEDILAFAISHTLLHENKQVGRLATILEARDHDPSKSLDKNELQIISVKLLLNAIRLCTIAGMTGDHAGDLIQRLFPARE